MSFVQQNQINDVVDVLELMNECNKLIEMQIKNQLTNEKRQYQDVGGEGIRYKKKERDLLRGLAI